MKILLLAGYMPWKENRRAACGLLYSLVKCRPSEVNITIYSFNFNNIPSRDIDIVREELNCEINVIPQSWWNKLLHGSSLFTRLFIWLSPLPHPTYFKIPQKIIDVVSSNEYDAVWMYPHDFYRLAYQIQNQKFVITGMDCESWNKLTRLSDPYFMQRKMESLHQLVYQWQDIRRERLLNKENILLHLVGLTDLNFYERHTKANNAFFLLHPHYQVHKKTIKFSEDKLKVLIAGAYNFFMKTDVDIMVDNFQHESQLQDKVHITFLGKGWDSVSEKLQEAGYDCEIKTWVENYVEELVNHDVQITPITNGGGTKGKVLDALANGLLVISSQQAALNIAVRNHDSILVYNRPQEISKMLLSIYNNKERFERIAEKGRMQVLTYHNPERISGRFFGIIKNKFNIK